MVLLLVGHHFNAGFGVLAEAIYLRNKQGSTCVGDCARHGSSAILPLEVFMISLSPNYVLDLLLFTG